VLKNLVARTFLFGETARLQG